MRKMKTREHVEKVEEKEKRQRRQIHLEQRHLSDAQRKTLDLRTSVSS